MTSSASILVPILFFGSMIYFVIALWRLQRGQLEVTLRPLPGIQTLPLLAGRAVEEGSALHLALGTGRLNSASAAETLMGLATLDELATQAARTGRAPIVTTADPIAMLVAQDQLRAGDAERGWRRLDNARFLAPTPDAYGLGTRGMMARENLGMNVLLGHFGDEYLFLAAEHPSGGTNIRAPQIAGTARIESLPLVYLTSEYPLLGEELFAIGAYLGRWPSHLASLLAQDGGRLAIVAAIIVGALWRTFLGG
jgi:hypothetical protein